MQNQINLGVLLKEMHGSSAERVSTTGGRSIGIQGLGLKKEWVGSDKGVWVTSDHSILDRESGLD